MHKDYSKYQVSDYLIDDYFVDSMLNPTEDSEAFWKENIDSGKIEINEFISAFMNLKSLHENKPNVPDERIELLLERISTTNKSKNKRICRFKYIRYAAVACSIVGIISLSVFSYLKIQQKNTNQQIAEFAKENIIHTKQPSNEIQLISGKQTIDVQGVQAKVEYDGNGKLKVNKQTVEVNQMAIDEKSPIIYNQLRVPYGKRAFLTLSDGTLLWVNTGTTVIYPTTFAKDKREIYVEGEVYAEVFHDAKHPFIIKTEKIEVQVLGTVFNVTAYKEDKQTNVVLVHGSVAVKPQSGKSTVIKPNQLFAYTDRASTLRTVDIENYTSWHDGIYIFHNEPIEDILLRLSRYYNVTMKLPSNPSGISCSGKLELKDDLKQLLDGLSEIAPLSYGEKNNEYKIKFE
ncbi:MAG: FecR domain-containing protein [Bacteroidota bacterium]|nr:FecR domain-containing protein [Bacteroidota bacterium]